jgi:carbon storage regulator
MLVLTRKAGEEIIIDGRIRVRVLQTGQGRIRLGIEAPPEVAVIRGELTDAPVAVPATVTNRTTHEAGVPLGAAML